MSDPRPTEPYTLSPEAVREPPRSLGRADAHFRELLRDWERRGGSDAALADLADEHLWGGLYILRCMPPTEPT